jgi:alpha-tubulin suppressor-like RCC1 family protein
MKAPTNIQRTSSRRRSGRSLLLTFVVALIGTIGLLLVAVERTDAQGQGEVWAWGNNATGALGDGTTTNSSTPVQVSGLSDVKAVDVGYRHSLALKNDGSVWAWGQNNSGQLGDGTYTDRTTPAQVSGLPGVQAVAGGLVHSLALKNDGTVLAWGNNQYGQLGDGTTTRSTTPVQVSGLSGVQAIAEGPFSSLALKNDGSVWAWGYNAYGQLGDGTTTDRLTPVQVSGLSGVQAIAGGQYHSLALKNDGTVLAWGRNNYGQLGDGTYTDRTTPVQVSGLSDVQAIAGGQNHSLALKNDGTLWAWGYNSLGQLGDGTIGGSHTTPAPVSSLEDVKAVAGGGMYSLALKNDGTLWAWGYNYWGQLGDGTFYNRTTPVQVLSGVQLIAAGFEHSLAVTSSNDTTPPRVTSTVPTTDAKGVAPTINVEATFSEDMLVSQDPAISSITGKTFKLFKQGTTTKIAAQVSYNADTDTASLNPTNNLRRGVTYKAVVTTGAKDLAGNQLDQKPDVEGLQQKAWLFKIRS